MIQWTFDTGCRPAALRLTIATQVALRRYRSGPWLLVLAGVALLGEVVAGTVYGISQPVETPLGNIIYLLTPVCLVLGLLLLIPGLIYSLKARRWRRVLAHHAWRAVRYRYTQRVSITTTTSEGLSTSTSVLGQLRILDPSAADGTSPRWVNFDSTWTPWGKWRLRPWRQARKGVAWIAGDLSGALVVALPGPGRLFGAHGGHPLVSGERSSSKHDHSGCRHLRFPSAWRPSATPLCLVCASRWYL